MPRVAWFSLPVLLTGMLILSTLPGCTGAGKTTVFTCSGTPSGATATNPALAELDALPVPDGADPATFAMLKESFRTLLLSGDPDNTARQASTGLGVTVDDLTYTDLGGGVIQLDWTYRHLGDYDQNSQVTVSDISPVGQYYNSSGTSANWAVARAADGDLNGMVTVSDLTPVGQNFGSTVSGYTIESSTNPGDPATWTEAATVPFSLGVRPTGQAFRTFSVQLTGQAAGLGYRATAVVGSSGVVTTYDEQEDNDTYTTPNALPAGNVSGFSGSLGSGGGYSGYDGDLDDLFSFQAAAGQDVNITLAFNATTADLDLYLLNSSGDTLLNSIGTTSPEQIAAHINVGGTFLIAAQAYGGYSDYTLDVTFSGGANQAPTAALTASPGSGTSPLEVSLSAAGSSDTDGSIVSYEWDWEGDGIWDYDSGFTPLMNHIYTVTTAMSFTPRVRVTDDGGLTDIAEAIVSVSPAGFVEPPVESFIDYSQAGDTPFRKWLLNCYRVLPPWADADRCFQSAAFAAWADEVLTIVNQHRALSGLAALTRDPHLELVAQAHARDMALQGYFAHDNLYGMAYTDRLDAVERPAYTVGSGINGENIYAGRQSPPDDTPAAAVAWWMNSPPHRANILNANVTHIGIGVYYRTGDPEGLYTYFVQVFANWAVNPDSHDWLEPAEVPAP